ncbi:hypothetical protein NS341_08915 [Staphylococcus xylosus]|uniref:hypothetical protein n=1 Tax=Staphylococcus xylosus TaxID=1288 RepID=UPI000733C6E1|nr:hypothetical protein [Staphylococcus xylosus]KTW21962.1 hypothetical protein NS341_08915 [Staphylococcus xylosus]
MNIKDLQKLDFLLKKANKHSHNIVEHKIVFEMNGQIYTGDFIPEIDQMEVKLPDVSAHESDRKKSVALKNKNEWMNISKSETNIFEYSDLYKVISRSDNENKISYFNLVDELSEKYPIDFEDPLPTYLYNPVNLSNSFPIDIKVMKISENTEFGFITIIPKDKLNN